MVDKSNFVLLQSDAKFLQDEVHNQWLDANLMEIGCHCLPAKLADQKRTVLEEKYVLQVCCTFSGSIELGICRRKNLSF